MNWIKRLFGGKDTEATGVKKYNYSPEECDYRRRLLAKSSLFGSPFGRSQIFPAEYFRKPKK